MALAFNICISWLVLKIKSDTCLNLFKKWKKKKKEKEREVYNIHASLFRQVT